MNHLWFLVLNWPWWLLVVALVVAAIAIWGIGTWGKLALAFVLYCGIHWHMWPWVPVLFWLLIVLALLAMFLSLMRSHPQRLPGLDAPLLVGAASILARIALAIPSLMLVITVFGRISSGVSGSPFWGWLTVALVIVAAAGIVLAIFFWADERLRSGLIVATAAAMVAALVAGLIFGFGGSSSEEAGSGSGSTTTTTTTTTVTDSSGSSSTSTSKDVTVSKLTADFSAKPQKKGSLTVVFDASASTPDTGSKLTKYIWKFGDGAGATCEGAEPKVPCDGLTKVTHKYAKAGTYSVTLTVVETGGQRIALTANVKTTKGVTDAGYQNKVAGAQAHLTVDNSIVDCVALTVRYYGKTQYGFKTVVALKGSGQVTQAFVRFALQGTSGSLPLRLWSDSVNVPLARGARTLQGEQASVCHDLSQAKHVFQALGSVKIGGKRIGTLNKAWWPKHVSKWAERCWTHNVKVHLECAKTVSYLATLLQQFASAGVKQVPVTTWNMHRAGPVVGSIPDFVRNPVQEKDSYFIVLQWTEKTGGCWVRVGINVGRASGINGGDQRFAGLPCVAPKPPAKSKPKPQPRPSGSTPATPSVPHGCKYYGTCPKNTTPTAPTTPSTRTTTPSTRTTTPTTRSTTPTTPTTPSHTCPANEPHGKWPVCKDGPSDDPQAQGNVPSQAVQHSPAADNSSEIAKGPVKPTDTGNGIPSGATSGPSAPRATPAPAPSSTHVSGTATMAPTTELPAPPSTSATASSSIAMPTDGA